MVVRRCNNHSLLLSCAFLASCVWMLMLLRLKLSSLDTHEEGTPPLSRSSSLSTPAGTLGSQRQATKSLDEMNKVPELSGHVLFFNRVPKTGSEMLVLLLQWLQGINGFRHIRLPGGSVRNLSRVQQEELVEDVTFRVRREAVPLTFDRHVYFINFTEFDQQSPTFLNLVRDPVDKAVSRFYYNRATSAPRNPDMRYAPPRPLPPSTDLSFERCVLIGDPACVFTTGQHYDLTIPYYCGHRHFCTELNNEAALLRAKANVDRYFPVVGVLEQLNETLAVLENKLPYFFKGVQSLYFQELLEPHKNRNRKRPQIVRADVRKIVESSLHKEYDFYYWLQARLLLQYRSERTFPTPTAAKYLKPNMSFGADNFL